ncbi:hypothetical protein TPHA_0C01820 [Tetrapisispora phaffii CBS 4417]|uniref:Trafficking protein particle complex subunit n=1 Tax=Tetrapisispora phaffii (strain ATCC 24235 / CBS 4417 / NBRC 1672 / NRRL Y-8282 / UCD 70-5) TaxID=1071381 RepID=G8BRG2_TETPH|nr:hypothetical protein TPHA_0C01820 [Tetrapisispora phaffii CBS 4417]CCE62338.1 hypothetical protein TPHA_0C01820 [Tetrapisispora phaffii CBS 4417]
MAIQTLLIINKSGGLIYHRNYAGEKNGLNSNDYLILASTLHSVFAIASQLTPQAVQLNAKRSSNSTDNNFSKGGEKIPYIPYVGMNANDSNNTTNKLNKLGSFMGDDYFKESFVSWNKGGLRQLSTDHFTMFIYQTMTGMKFVAISSSVLRNTADPSHSGKSNTTANANGIQNSTTISYSTAQNSSSDYNSNSSNLQVQIADNFLRKIYCIYSDYVMKDPFYSLEMPIKSELFDKKVKQMVSNLE